MRKSANIADYVYWRAVERPGGRGQKAALLANIWARANRLNHIDLVRQRSQQFYLPLLIWTLYPNP
jgi:hypothetical protein